MLKASFKPVLGKFQGCLEKVSRVFPENVLCIKNTSLSGLRMFQNYSIMFFVAVFYDSHCSFKTK